MEGYIELLQQGEGFQPEGNVQFGQEYSFESVLLQQLFIFVFFHDEGILVVQLADKMGLDQESGHLSIVQHNSHKVENGSFSIEMLPWTTSEYYKLKLTYNFLSYHWAKRHVFLVLSAFGVENQRGAVQAELEDETWDCIEEEGGG